MTQNAPRLIADIGGTNARFSLILPGTSEPQNTLVLSCDDFPGLAETTLAYLERKPPPAPPVAAAFAIASPVLGDRVELTNRDWSFSIAELKNRLNLERLDVVNDFIAVALSVPRLGANDKVVVGGGVPAFNAPIGVIGPGTGLGVAALVPTDNGWHPISTEGGHVTMPATNDKEAQVIDWLHARHGHVSAERILSGPGLVNLFAALSELSGKPTANLSPHELTSQALAGDPLASEALAMFFAMLGTVAGNLALTLGARGGVQIAGGIIPRLLDLFLASDFRRRFEDKGRFSAYLRAIPVHVITHPYPAFVGLAGLVGSG
jgi:glucokinase